MTLKGCGNHREDDAAGCQPRLPQSRQGNGVGAVQDLVTNTTVGRLAEELADDVAGKHDTVRVTKKSFL